MPVVNAAPIESLRRFVEELSAIVRPTLTAVMLTDGETLVGYCGMPEGGLTEDLLLTYRDLYEERWIRVPLGDIAGIRTIEATQDVFPHELSLRGSEEARRQVTAYLSRFSPEEAALRQRIWDRQRDLARVWLEHHDSRIETGDEPGLGEPPSGDPVAPHGFEALALDRKLMPLVEATSRRRAIRHGYTIEHRSLGINYALTASTSFDGDFEPGIGERLYVDWTYVSTHQGEINGAGLGFVVNLSLSWNRSAARKAGKLADAALTPLSSACAKVGHVLVRGYVSFLEMPGSTLGEVASPDSLRMDDARWRAAVVCPRPIAGPPTAGSPWLLTYWRDGCEEMPFEILDRSTRPLDIFATVHTAPNGASLHFEDPDVTLRPSCLLKARYVQAAHPFLGRQP